MIEAATGGVLLKKVFLKTWQNWQENTCARVSFLIKRQAWGCMWCRGVVVITTAQLHSTRAELRLWAGSNPARGVSEIRDGEDLWQWSRM